VRAPHALWEEEGVVVAEEEERLYSRSKTRKVRANERGGRGGRLYLRVWGLAWHACG